MYYPNIRKLWPCSLKIYEANARFLTNDFRKISKKSKPNETPVTKDHVEFYDFTKLCIANGIQTGREAYDSLTKNYGLHDDRVSYYNVMKFKAYKFERIFVIYKEDHKKLLREIIVEGEA
jgi:hypothetical protein